MNDYDYVTVPTVCINSALSGALTMGSGRLTTASKPTKSQEIDQPPSGKNQARKRPPLPDFLPLSSKKLDNCESASPPMTLQSVLSNVSQSEQFRAQHPGYYGNAGMPYFPLGSPPRRRTAMSNIGTQAPSLKSPVDLLNYAAELKRANDAGADNVDQLEEALGFLKLFSDHVCASSQQAQKTPPGSSPDGSDHLKVPESPPHHGAGLDMREARPKSFLRDEMDEFDQIFSELLLYSPYKKFRDHLNDSEETNGDEETLDLSVDTVECFNDRPTMPVGERNMGANESLDHCDMCSSLPTDNITAGNSVPTLKCTCGRFIADSSSVRGAGRPGLQASPRFSAIWGENDKLFSQLLDDLDNITGDTPSVRRRKKARDLFSNWVFSGDPQCPDNSPSKKDALRSLAKSRSVEVPDARAEMFRKWRPRSFEYLSEDDADSGYHTGSSTLQSRAQRGARRPPGEYTLTREDLRRNIERFNNNNHGLIMSLQADNNTFQGFIRVHMNLIRPINMSLSSRPPSIYDALGKDELVEDVELNDVNQITSFYLPKDTTKVIHINSDTTTQEVIQVLLSKFKITDNPRKFALYEKSEEDDKAVMRRLEDDEVPLPLCLCWTKDGVTGLDRRKFVLQENDTGEIMWEAFSLPELENFLKILNREEEEYVEQVRGKYRMLKIHMERRLKELCPGETSLTGDKRNPVFV